MFLTQIVETAETEPPPVISNAHFADTLSAIIINFSSKTDCAGKTGLFLCDDLLLNPTGSAGFLGRGTKCSWDTVTNSILTISLGEGASVVPGDVITMKDDILRANSKSLFYSQGQFVTVEKPKQPLPVILSLSSPSILGKVLFYFIFTFKTITLRIQKNVF